MGYKIYFGDAPLYLSSVIDDTLNNIIHHDDGIFMDDFSHQGMKSMIHEMKLSGKHGGVYLYHDVEALFQEFKRNFTIISAGGGIIRNEKQELLMIFRRGKWDFPKGKLENGESIETCAQREVEEECGIKLSGSINPFTKTYHVYDEFGKHILKETHWFLMEAQSNQALVPQIEEEITAIEWVASNQLDIKLRNTYSQIRDLVALAALKS